MNIIIKYHQYFFVHTERRLVLYFSEHVCFHVYNVVGLPARDIAHTILVWHVLAPLIMFEHYSVILCTGDNERPQKNFKIFHFPQCHRCRKSWGSAPLACWLLGCQSELLLHSAMCISPPSAACDAVSDSLARQPINHMPEDHVWPHHTRISTSVLATYVIVCDQRHRQHKRRLVWITNESQDRP